jgi:hypothetical protein
MLEDTNKYVGFKDMEWLQGLEVWCGSVPLLEVFPGLYNLASNKEASIADNFDSVSGSR